MVTEEQKARLKAKQAERANGNVSRETIVGESLPGIPDNTPLEDIVEIAEREYEAATEKNEAQTALEPAGTTYTPTDIDFSNGEFNTVGVIRGMHLDDPEMSQEAREDFDEMAFSYIGVTRREISKYTGRWITCLGCVIAPIEGEVVTVDRSSGEVRSELMQWDIPLFKLEIKDDETGMNVIVGGGGRNGIMFARTKNALWGPGDWRVPQQIFITQEERQSVNRQTGEKEPHRLYRFAWRKTKQSK